MSQNARKRLNIGDTNGTNHSLKTILGFCTEINGVTDLSVLVELHNDPHRVLLYDPNQSDDVLVVEVLHDNWEQVQSVTGLNHTHCLRSLG